MKANKSLKSIPRFTEMLSYEFPIMDTGYSFLYEVDHLGVGMLILCIDEWHTTLLKPLA